MKRFAAAVAAFAMVVAAVMVRRGMDSTEKVQERVQVLCAQSIVDACRAWQTTGANIQVSAADFTNTRTVGDTVGLVIGPRSQAAALVPTTSGGQIKVLASSRVVIISRRSAPVCSTGALACIVALPKSDLAVQRSGELGPELAAALTEASSADPDVVDLLRSASTAIATGITPGQVQNLGIPPAALMVEASVGPAVNLATVPVVPAASVVIAAVATGVGSAAVVRTLLENPGLRTALRAQGWK